MLNPRNLATLRARLPIVLGLFWMVTMPLAAAEMTADEQAVWRLEEQ
jgi:hypothetical protein